jgi:hypothetical protein
MRRKDRASTLYRLHGVARIVVVAHSTSQKKGKHKSH